MEILGIVILIGVVAGLGIGGFAFYQTFDAQWVCITEECVSYATGNEWVSENCRPENLTGQTELVCEVDDNGKTYNVPLSLVNLSHPAIKSCKEYVCSRQVFVK